MPILAEEMARLRVSRDERGRTIARGPFESARLEQVPPGQRRKPFTVADKDVALFNVDGTIYAMDDTCLHQGSSLGAGQTRRQGRHLSRARLALRRPRLGA